MTNYLFKTETAMKPYNSDKWWIDSNIVRDFTVSAKNLDEALELYRQTIEFSCGIKISKNALKNKKPMYIDDEFGNQKQIGYVITAKTIFYTDDGRKSEQNIELWIEIKEINEIEF